MEFGERTTGTRDEQYNLIAVLYHALHGAENYDTYALDAEAAGRDEHAAFFREAQAMQRDLAERAKGLLGVGGGVIPEEAGGAMPGTAPLEIEVPPDTGPVDVRGRAAPEVGFPLEGEVAPGTAPEDVPPRTTDIPPESVTTPPDAAPPTDVVPPPDTPRAGGVVPGAGDATVGRDVPPDSAPGDIPPRSADVQREAQVRADQVSVPTERPTGDVPPQVGDLGREAATPTDTAPPDVDVEPSGRAEVPLDTPRAGDVPPSESRPGEEPPGAERGTGSAREYFSDIIRETGRRSRGEF